MLADKIPFTAKPLEILSSCAPSFKTALLITILVMGTLFALSGCLALLNTQLWHLQIPLFNHMPIYGWFTWILTSSAVSLGSFILLISCGEGEKLSDALASEEEIIQTFSPLQHWLSTLFKNEETVLSLSNPEPAPIEVFLKAYFFSCPTKGPEFTRWVECQAEIEQVKSSFENTINHFNAWQIGKASHPFTLLVRRPESPSIPAVLQISKESAIEASQLLQLLTTLKALQTNASGGKEQEAYKTAALGFGPFFLHFETTKEITYAKCVKSALVVLAGSDALHWITCVGLLQQELEKVPDWEHNLAWRAWAASSICYLRKRQDKLIDTRAELQEKIQKADNALTSIADRLLKTPLSANSPLALAPEIAPLSISGISFSERVNFPGQEEVQLHLSEPSATFLLPPPDLPSDFGKILETALSWHDFLFDLYEKGDFARVEAEATIFLNGLPPAKERVQQIESLSSSEKEILATQIYRISNLLLTNHLILGLSGFHPSRILALLKGLDLLQQIAQKTKETYFEKHNILIFSILYALKDHYLDLGPFQGEILAALESLNPNDVGIDFYTFPMTPWMTPSQQSHTSNMEWCKEWWDSDDKKAVRQLIAFNDLEGKFLPKQIVQLKQIYILLSTLLNPHICLDPTLPERDDDDRTKPLRKDFIERMESLKKALEPGILKLKQEKSLLKVASDFIVDNDNAKFSLNNFYWILSPNGMPIFDHFYRNYHCQSAHRYRDNTLIGLPFSPFYSLYPHITSTEIRNRVIEGMISERTHHNINEGGGTQVNDMIYFSRNKSSTSHLKMTRHVNYQGSEFHDMHLPEGLRHTQTHTQAEKFCFPGLSLEVSRALQLMQTGLNNRFSSTIYTFACYPELLTHPEYGNDLQQAFRMNVCQGDRMQREMVANAQLFPSILRNFEEMITDRTKVKDWTAWIFLYKVHADLMHNLQGTQYVASLKEAHASYRKELKCHMKTFTESNLLGACHIAYLYEFVIKKSFTQKEMISLGRSFFLIKNAIDALSLQNPFEHKMLSELGTRLYRSIDKAVKSDPSILDELLSLRFKKPPVPRTWIPLENGGWGSGSLSVIPLTGDVAYDNKMERILPEEIRKNTQLLLLFGEESLAKTYTFTCVVTPVGKLFSTKLTDLKSHEYILYLHTPNPLLYRHHEGKWEQLLFIQDPHRLLPIDAKKGFFWEREGESCIEDVNAKVLYQLTSEESGGYQLTRFTETGEEILSDPMKMPIFGAISSSERFVITTSDEECKVIYLEEDYGYKWNKETLCWDSLTLPQFYLSKTPLDRWIKSSLSNEKDSSLFASHFRFFHLIEEKQGGGAKLVMGCYPYNRSGAKHFPTISPNFQGAEAKELPGLILFDILADGSLHSKNPQDFLYLSYVLFAQGKYGEALVYLQRSQAIWTTHIPEQKKIREIYKSWFMSWQDTHPNGLALKMQMLFLEHEQNTYETLSEVEMISQDNILLSPLFTTAELYLKQEKSVDPILRLNPLQKETLLFYAPRALQWAFEKIRNPATLESAAKFLLPQEVEKFLLTNEKESDLPLKALHWALDRQISALSEKREKVLQKRKEFPKAPYHTTEVIKPLIDLSPWLASTREETRHLEAKKKIEAFRRDLLEIFDEKDGSLEADIAQKLATDLKDHIDNVEKTFSLKEEADLDECLRVLEEHSSQLKEIEKQCKKELLKVVPLPSLPPKVSIERALKEQEVSLESALDQFAFCFGMQDYTSLIEQGILEAPQVENFNKLFREYLIARTDSKLLQRKIEKIQALQRDPQNGLLRQECAAVLTEWCNYNPETHPFAHILLLVEERLNLSVRGPQVTHIEKLLEFLDAYIHEQMAGGKTTVLRNIFCAIQAQKGFLGSVVTYAPLMATHHTDFTSKNNRLGSRAYPFHFSRQTPRDAGMIKMLIIHHLTALTENGRLDQTPSAALSLKHTLSELLLDLKEASKSVLNDAYPSIQALQHLLRLRSEDLSIYADEMDKIFDPFFDMNYSKGDPKILEKRFYQPALTLLTLLQTTQELSDFCHELRSPVKKLSEKEFEKSLEILSEVVYDHLGVAIDKAKTISYLSERDQKDSKKQAEVIAFYSSTIQALPPDVKIQLQVYHCLIGIVMRSLKGKTAGVQYGRSKVDGISVKPYAFSAQCRESSQRSFPFTTVMEACFDYFVHGVTEQGIAAYIAKVRRAAEEERQNDPALSIPETQAGKLFQADFQISLQEVSQKHFAFMKAKIDTEPQLLNKVLEAVFFKDYVYYPSKIEGYPHYLLFQSAHCAGASGSPERLHTLPSGIKKPEETVRQKGAIGSVFYSLFLGLDENNI